MILFALLLLVCAAAPIGLALWRNRRRRAQSQTQPSNVGRRAWRSLFGWRERPSTPWPGEWSGVAQIGIGARRSRVLHGVLLDAAESAGDARRLPFARKKRADL